MFAALSVAVFTGATQSLDRSILLDFPRPSTLDSAARAVTFLGGNAFTICLALVASLVAFRRAGRSAFLPPIAVVTGVLVQNLLKTLFHRPRPELVPHGVDVSGWSYPSGHAMMSAVAYFSLAALISRIHRDKTRAAISAGALLAILIGLTRLYFGVHWPSDILGGWLIGFGYASLIDFAGHRLLTTDD